MTHTVTTYAQLPAPVEVVWDVLTRFDEYRLWCPTLWFDGPPAQARVGATLALRVRLPAPLPSAPIPVRITCAEANRELAWRGGLSGLAAAEHGFMLAADEETGGTRLTHWEAFEGALVRVVWPALRARLQPRYESFNVALGARARVASSPGIA